MRADAAAKRRMILSVAQGLVADGAPLSLNRVAALAGVGVGTVYRHFPDTDALLFAVRSQELEDLSLQIRDAAAAATDQSAVSRVQTIIRLALRAGSVTSVLEALAIEDGSSGGEAGVNSESTSNPDFRSTARAIVRSSCEAIWIIARRNQRSTAILLSVDDVERLVCAAEYASRLAPDPQAVSDLYVSIVVAGLFGDRLDASTVPASIPE